MVESAGNEPSRPALTTAEALAERIIRLSSNPLLKAGGYSDLLKLLVEYIGQQQRRLADAETRLAVLERRARNLESGGATGV